MAITRNIAAGLLVPLLSAGAQQQAPPPVRDIGPVIAVSADSVRRPVTVRGLPGGGVLVAEFVRHRLLLLDSGLAHTTVVLDSMSSAFSSSLIPFSGDSTLYVERVSYTLLVIDEHGNVARTISAPKTADLNFIALASTYGEPVVDAAGRLVYRAAFAAIPGVSPLGPAIAARLSAVPDSAPLVRADFGTRTIDTIAAIGAIPYYRTVAATMDSAARRVTFKDLFNPLPSIDDWVGLSDGTIAIVRAHDYHVDFIDPDGRKRSTPPLPYKWKRLSDADKQQMVDSMRPMLAAAASQTLAAGLAVQTVYGLKRAAREIDPAPLSAIPDYEPPFVPGTTHADRDGHLWILPRLSVSMSAGLLYDVVNRDGQIVERVRLPAGRVLAGFGPGGVAYLTTADALTTRIEAVRIR